MTGKPTHSHATPDVYTQDSRSRVHCIAQTAVVRTFIRPRCISVFLRPAGTGYRTSRQYLHLRSRTPRRSTSAAGSRADRMRLHCTCNSPPASTCIQEHHAQRHGLAAVAQAPGGDRRDGERGGREVCSKQEILSVPRHQAPRAAGTPSTLHHPTRSHREPRCRQQGMTHLLTQPLRAKTRSSLSMQEDLQHLTARRQCGKDAQDGGVAVSSICHC